MRLVSAKRDALGTSQDQSGKRLIVNHTTAAASMASIASTASCTNDLAMRGTWAGRRARGSRYTTTICRHTLLPQLLVPRHRTAFLHLHLRASDLKRPQSSHRRDTTRPKPQLSSSSLTSGSARTPSGHSEDEDRRRGAWRPSGTRYNRVGRRGLGEQSLIPIMCPERTHLLSDTDLTTSSWDLNAFPFVTTVEDEQVHSRTTSLAKVHNRPSPTFIRRLAFASPGCCVMTSAAPQFQTQKRCQSHGTLIE